ncbi:unnamed protein product, partial [Closterium sp. NIES-54]
WHDTLRTTLAALGFAPSTADPSLFLRTDTILPLFYVLVYVDDLVFATADTKALAHVKSELQKRHTCTDLGELTSYLGLRITRDIGQRTITLTQSHMVQQVLQRFRFTYSSPQSTPLPTGHSLLAISIFYPVTALLEQTTPTAKRACGLGREWKQLDLRLARERMSDSAPPHVQHGTVNDSPPPPRAASAPPPDRRAPDPDAEDAGPFRDDGGDVNTATPGDDDVEIWVRGADD